MTTELLELHWKELYRIAFEEQASFSITLADKTVLQMDHILRMIPKRRIVAYGLWNHEPVVIKLFFDKHRAKIRMEKDAAGIKTLQKNKVPTPPLLYQGESIDKRIYALVLSRIDEAETLETLWKNRKNIEEVYTRLEQVIRELATQHVFGIVQKDLHLKNFLITEKIIYTLDGAQVELHPEKLDKKPSMGNIALFLSQLGVGVKDCQEKLFKFYAKTRGWILKPEDIIELFLLIQKINDKRWLRYQKKIGRSATDFQRIDLWNKQGMVYRKYAGNEMIDFIKNPDALFQRKNNEILKAGRSATVIKTVIDNHHLVAKRYNLKNLWHRMRRLFRTTRAKHVWRLAHKLSLFGVRTAQPVAYLEYNFFGFHARSYYLMEYVSGVHVGEYFKQHRGQEEKINIMVNRVTKLFQDLAKLGITHGDLKVTNILVNQNEEPVLIDLDGAAEHASLSGLDHTYRKEIQRFLKNFEDQPTILEKFRLQLT